MEAALAALEASAPARYFATARWGYAGLNAAHILGLALLVGTAVPLNLRLLGVWRWIERGAVARLLVPVAATGLALALATGLVLFAVRATGYAALPILWVKLALIACGTLAALRLHRRDGWWLAGTTAARARAHAAVSLTCWLGALLCGRLIAFVD